MVERRCDNRSPLARTQVVQLDNGASFTMPTDIPNGDRLDSLLLSSLAGRSRRE